LGHTFGKGVSQITNPSDKMMSFDQHDECVSKKSDSVKKNTGLRTPHLSVAGVSEKDAHSLATDVAQSKLTTLAVMGAATKHSEVMRILYQNGVKESKTIKSLSVVASLGDIEAFVDVLSTLHCLKLWSNSIESEIADRLGVGMANNTTLKELSICFDNQSFKSVEPLLLSLAQREDPLEKLVLRGTSFSDFPLEPENHDSLLRCMNYVIAAGKAPRELEIVSCDAPERDWVQMGQCLAKSTSLISLSIVNSTLRPASIQSLSDGLRYTTSIERLRLCRNKLGNDGVRMLSLGLVENQSVTTLQLVHNEVGDDSISNLSRLLKKDGRIQDLNLTKNDIGTQGAMQLMKLVSSHMSLHSLSLAENGNIGLEGLKLIGESIPSIKLRKLEISLRPFWEMTCSLNRHVAPGAKELREAAGRALVNGVESNYHIHELSVSWVDVPPKFKNVIRFYTDLNKCGRHLVAEERAMSPTIWCPVMAKCGDASLIYYLFQQNPELVKPAPLIS
jgi:hypothetical protein